MVSLHHYKRVSSFIGSKSQGCFLIIKCLTAQNDFSFITLRKFSLLFPSVVCLEDDRDDIRSRIIGWLRTQNNSLEGLQDYKNLLKSYFDLMDEDNNERLDAMEFKEFVQANQTAEMVLLIITCSDVLVFL